MTSCASSDAALNDAALLGVAAGLRAFTPFGVLALRGPLGDGAPARLLPLLAVGELVGDKLPMVPPRTAAGPLAARAASGALLGYRRGGARGAVAAAACAVVAAYGGQHTRTFLTARAGAPDAAVALAEDALAVALAALGSRPVRA